MKPHLLTSIALLALTTPAFAEAPAKTEQSKPVAAPVANSTKVTDVWVAFKTHFDIGYTDTVENVLKKYRVNMMDGALKVIDEDRKLPPEKRFAWMVPGWPLRHILGPLQDPARKVRIEQAVREGSLAVGAIPFSFHTETEDLEDLVRGMGYASQICRQYDRPYPISAKMTDVPCHSWIWPTLLNHSGVKFLQLGCNDMSGHLQVPPLFKWEGPDGSRVFCNFTPRYGSGLIPPRDWPAKNYLAMIMTGDNHGPMSQAEVENLRKSAEKNLPGVRIHFGTLDDFTRALMAENPDLPVVRGDMPDTWIHGWMSMPVESKLARTARPLQPALETLDTQLRAWGLTTGDIVPVLADAYEQSALYSEHTFGPHGPDMGPWNSRMPHYVYGDAWKAAYAKGAYKRYEAAFDTKRDYARKEAALVDRELKSRLELLAGSVNADGKRLVVYNALPWERSGLVEVPGESGGYLFAEKIPANGYRTYNLDALKKITPEEQASSDTLTTPFYKITFDLKRGGVASLVETKTGRELVDTSGPYALGQFLHERFDKKRMLEFHNAYGRPTYSWIKGNLPKGTEHTVQTPSQWKLTVRHSELADIATLTAVDTLGLAEGISLSVTLPRNLPSVDIEWRIKNKTPDPLPEGGWLCLPFAVKQPKFLLGRLGGAVDPAKDIVTGANKDLLYINSGLTITGGDKTGIGLCPIDSPCVSLGKPGLWSYSLDYTPAVPTVFVNLYNNEWNTNFPEWQDGSWTSRVRLWPTADLAVPSWETRLPLLAAVADGPAGKLPAAQTGLTLSRPGVLVTAFGPNPDGKGTVLRVWDQSGERGDLTVTLPGKFTTATPVNLRGQPAGVPIDIKDGKLAFPLNAFAPASFVLE